MQDKTIVITGGNAGIGKATAIALAKKGATIIIGTRLSENGPPAVQEIRAASGNDRVSFEKIDLSDFASVQNFAASISSLDVLINNAGVFTSSYQYTKHGFERTIGTNYIGPYLLTRLLLPLLEQSGDPRVINVSSGAHYQAEIQFDRFREDPGGSFGTMAYYGQSKLANVLFAREFARRFPQIQSYSLHPGVVATGFVNKHTNWFFNLGWKLIKPLLVSPAKGAEPSVYLATANEIDAPNGQYFDNNLRPRKPSRHARNDQLAKELWERTEDWVQDYLE